MADRATTSQIYFSRTELRVFGYIPRLSLNFLAYLGLFKPENIRQIESSADKNNLDLNFEH